MRPVQWFGAGVGGTRPGGRHGPRSLLLRGWCDHWCGAPGGDQDRGYLHPS